MLGEGTMDENTCQEWSFIYRHDCRMLFLDSEYPTLLRYSSQRDVQAALFFSLEPFREIIS
jgi:hypothetical protein